MKHEYVSNPSVETAQPPPTQEPVYPLHLQPCYLSNISLRIHPRGHSLRPRAYPTLPTFADVFINCHATPCPQRDCGVLRHRWVMNAMGRLRPSQKKTERILRKYSYFIFGGGGDAIHVKVLYK